MSSPLSLIVKPTGAACNLDCAYCYFLAKEELWGHEGQRMDDATVEQTLRSYLTAAPDGEVIVTWQGGEPTLRGLDFFRRAVDLGRQLARPGQSVRHGLQTNATLIDDEWGSFLAQERFLVGVSIDGPPQLDVHRRNAAGLPSHAAAVRGWHLLQRHGVELNVLTTVHTLNVTHPLEVYRFLRDDLGASHLQFIPIVEPVPGGVSERTVGSVEWGSFLCTIVDEWLAHDVGRVSIQHVDILQAAMLGEYLVCSHSPVCGRSLVADHRGTVYSCDHFVDRHHTLGTVADDLASLLATPAQQAFGWDKRAGLPGQCHDCPVRWVCNGGCPKDRIRMTAAGEPGLNWLCEGYLTFFTHAYPPIRARVLQHLADA